MKLLLIALYASLSFASVAKAPANFTNSEGNLIFIDFTSASHALTFNVNEETATVHTTINFTVDTEGMPIFDLAPAVTSAKLNGIDVKIGSTKDPDGQTSYRFVKKSITAGEYTLELVNSFTSNTKFDSSGVSSGFWISDLQDRQYLEQYIPTNIEYDQYKIDFEVKIEGTERVHKIYNNGFLTKIANNHFKISYPQYFTSSSLYFHLSKDDRFEEREFTFTSTNGASIPVIAYARRSWSLGGIEEKITDILNELESKFGAWGHPSVTIYIAGMGGMEHCGATITSISALGHELTHSYFARGIMPVDGNSGWIDEATASWRDGGYQKATRPNFSSTKMSSHSQYKRTTDRMAYTQGANFMAFLNFELTNVGGLHGFLSKMYSIYNHQNITTSLFKTELELFSGKDYSAEFDQYIYGKNSRVQSKAASIVTPNPMHPKLSKKDLLNLL